MPNTAPHNIYYPDAATAVAPLHPVLGSMAASVEAALTTTDGVVAGHTASIATLGTQTTPWYATTTARDAAIPSPTAGRMATTGTGAALREWVHNGTTWVQAVDPTLFDAWTAYTPTWTNLTLGNGTQAAAYQAMGKTIHYRIYLVFGSTTTVSGIFYPSWPVAAPIAYMPGSGLAYRNATVSWRTCVVTNGYFLDSTSGRFSTTNPWPWAANDIIAVTGTYEAP